ncbi:MAG TPA: hypothetical protein VFE50_25125, partial [Cyclobacteriaceae bacterium]|nr:hypothetical protein [Cyclobacteriaceae bacterium]
MVHNLLGIGVIPTIFQCGIKINSILIFKTKIQNTMISRLPRLFVTVLFCGLLIATGCKSKKKAMEAQAAEKARMEQEAAAKKQRDEEEARRKREEEERT